MTHAIHHSQEPASNTTRDQIGRLEPKALRTFTPSQAVIARSAGIYHWTPEGRRLYDFSSGVLVSNLGHNPESWMKRFSEYMGWWANVARMIGFEEIDGRSYDEYLAWRAVKASEAPPAPPGYFSALPMTAYNAITPVETDATRRLLEVMQGRPGGKRMEQVLWAASGSEAIQKALWAALARDRSRDVIIATRCGFHGKKGLANAVTGCETDRDRDPRVRFITFPTTECADVALRGRAFDPEPYQRELEQLRHQFGGRLSVLITEPYLGGGGSYHPPKEYLQLVQAFCRQHDIIFILDEVQANFGRTGDLFAYETYGLEPDIVVLGKGLGNGIPVAAAVGRTDLFASLDYGEGSDTWSANPLCCAAVLATLDEFAARDVLGPCRQASAVIEAGLVRLKELPFISHIRGEKGGMVWGVEPCDHDGKSAAEWANALVLACYRGDGGDGIHLLGPLAKKVVRVAPPLVITEVEARESMALMQRLLAGLTPSEMKRGALVGAS